MTIGIGSRKHLFLDERLVAERRGVRRAVNRPRLAEVVLEPGPEGAYNDAFVGGYGTVLDDEGLCKMWVHGRSASILAGRFHGRTGPRAPWEELATARSTLPLGYYTSRDGVRWEAPPLGLFEWNGSRENNICCLDWGYVFKDPHPRSPAERYKMLSHPTEALGVRSEKEARSLALGGLYFFLSPDGVHWTFHPTRVLAAHPDCNNMILYDARIGKYVAYVRCWPGKLKRNYGRAVARVELDDPLQPWPTLPLENPRHFWGAENVPAVTRQFPVVMFYPNYEAEDSWTDIYDPNVVQYPWADDAYLAFPELNHRLHDSPHSNHSRLEIGFCVSRDGVQWDWPSLEAYVPFGPEGSGRTGMLYNIPGMVRRGNEIYQYHFGTPLEHGRTGEGSSYESLLHSGRIWRSVQRLDGFLSMDFEAGGGELLTQPLVFRGSRLVLNVRSGDGAVELCDEGGAPLPGFARADCEPLRADATAHPVRWRGGEDVSLFQGRPVRVRFLLRDAQLFALQFA